LFGGFLTDALPPLPPLGSRIRSGYRSLREQRGNPRHSQLSQGIEQLIKSLLRDPDSQVEIKAGRGGRHEAVLQMECNIPCPGGLPQLSLKDHEDGIPDFEPAHPLQIVLLGWG
jgi:hypothetical protein